MPAAGNGGHGIGYVAPVYGAFAESALLYANLGYAVLPLAPGSKAPATVRGLYDATTDANLVRDRWADKADANVGLLPPSRVLVLDVDDPDRLPELVAGFDELGAAPLHRTPSGGYHVFVRVPPGWTMPTRVHAVAGVDVRGLGRAYVVAPPSVHGGRDYEVVRPLVAPDQLQMASAGLLSYLCPVPHERTSREIRRPRSAREKRRLRSRATSALRREVAAVANAQVGTRNDTLNVAAYVLGPFVEADALDREQVIVALAQAAEKAGLPTREAAGTIASGLNAGRRSVR